MFSLESPHRGDSNDCTQYTIFNIKRKIDLNYLKSAAMWELESTSTLSNARRGHFPKVKKEQCISTLLAKNNIKISTSHCRSLVSLFKLCTDHQTLLKCNLSIHLLLGNIKLVKEICSELNW